MKKILLISTYVILCTSIFAQNTSKFLKDANNLYKSGKYEQSLKLCEMILLNDKEDIDALSNKASASWISCWIYKQKGFSSYDIYKSYLFAENTLNYYNQIVTKFPNMQKYNEPFISAIIDEKQRMLIEYPGCDKITIKSEAINNKIEKNIENNPNDKTKIVVEVNSNVVKSEVSYQSDTLKRISNLKRSNTFIPEFNLSNINSYTTLSIGKQFFRPYKFINGVKEFPKTYMSEISHNGKFAIASGDWRAAYEESQRLYFIDLTDGKIFYEYKFQGIKDYFFSPDDSLIYFYENNLVKTIDLKSYQINTIFKIDKELFEKVNLYLSNNDIHLSSIYNGTIIHYTFNLLNKKLDFEIFNLPQYDSYGKDIIKEFAYYQGTTEDKLLKIKLIQGSAVQIKPLSKYSKDEFLIFSCPQLYVIKNGVIILNTNLSIYKSNKITNEIKEIYNFRPPTGFLTDDYQVIINSQESPSNGSLYVLNLGSTEGFSKYEDIKTTFVNPFEIHSQAIFSKTNNITGKLYYQYDNEIFVTDYKNISNINEQTSSKSGFVLLIEKNDQKLSNYLGTYLNSETLKNQPLESDNEKYLRVKKLYESKLPDLISLQDSLISNFNMLLLESIHEYKFQPSNIFNISNYDINNEYWKLNFKNPFGGNDFSIIYDQSKADAKIDLANNFSNISLIVKYYFNPLNYLYEPILLEISNSNSNKIQKYIIPFKDLSLVKNLYLTNNSYLTHKYWTDNFILDLLEKGDITYDASTLKYFVNNGKPKYYFNYGFNNYKREVNVSGVSVFDIDDSNFRLNLLDKFTRFIPLKNSKFYIGENVNEYLRFDFIPYFINKTYEKNFKPFTSVYDLNKIEPISYKNDLIFPNSIEYQDSIIKNLKTPIDFKNKDLSFSPNGKYCAIKVDKITYLYKTTNWENICKFNNSSGQMYWDCNSYFLGIGQDVLPVQLIEKILDKKE